jgi:cytochrome c peroxidase
MKPILFATLLVAGAAGLQAADAAQAPATPATLRAKAKDLLGVLPDKMPGSENDTPARIELGRKLYFDNRLSMNDSQSCNTCHDLTNKKGGVDNQPTSEGAFHKRGERNSPTTLNAGFHFAQFWDGRAKDLKEQAKGPVMNPVEMAMPDEATVVKKLGAVKEYKDGFAKAFPGVAQPIGYDNMAEAIAAFERTLITHDRLDDFQKGDDKALSALELKGLDLFLSIGCTTCHNGPVLGGNTYQKVGLIHPYETKDLGRFVVTKEEGDEYKFKVPSLRNIVLTGPYFHDGTQTDLRATTVKMAHMQLDRELKPDEADALSALMNALTDKARAK